MKKNLILGLLLGLLAPAMAFAHGSKADLTRDVMDKAMDKFLAEETAQVAKFTGVKGWPAGNKIMVKIYLSGNNTVAYTCSVMEMPGQKEDMVSCVK